MTLIEMLDGRIYNNTVLEWITAVLGAVFIYCAVRIVQEFLIKRLSRYLSQRHAGWNHPLLDAVGKTRWLVIAILSLYAGLRGLALPTIIDKNMDAAAFAVFLFQVGLWCAAVIDNWVRRYRDRQVQGNPAAATTLGAVRMIAISALWVGILLLILENIGMDITALVAGLGIGGIAVALAAQNILGDLFASLSIVLDKTFMVGDSITVDSFSGTVETIGLKSTRIRSVSGEQIILSNSDLLRNRIRNYGRMYERRVAVTLSLSYDTPRDSLRQVPAIIRAAVEAQDGIRFDRAHFLSYSETALVFEYVYFVRSASYIAYVDAQQAINFLLHERFEAAGIEFARPSRAMTLRLEGEAGKPAALSPAGRP